MRTKLNKVIYRVILLASFLYELQVFAQPIPCDNDPVTPAPPCPPDDDIPINENITILLIVAVLFGLYIIYNNKLNKKRLA
jgi:hypothetical protein